MDAQSLRNQIADLQRQANLKRDEAQRHLQSAAAHSGAGQGDRASSDQSSANSASQEAMGFEDKIQALQTQLANKEREAAELDKKEQQLRSELNQVQQKKDSVLGNSSSTPLI